MLYDLIIAPIEMIVDWIFYFVTNRFNKFGIIGAIASVSIVINYLSLPLYAIADRLQKCENDIVKKMAYRVKRIKQAFKGDEQFMMLQTYYRQNNYHPLYALRGSLSIMIQVPFFIAAYHYLSNCEVLQNSSFWIIKDLSAPDGLVKLGSLTINLLPIIMTAINVISGVLYTRGNSLREKIQVYGLAAFFLVLLYNSPAGLVIYWIMNNCFSLIKNIDAKVKPKGLILYLLASLVLLAVPIYCFFLDTNNPLTKKKLVFSLLCIFIVVALPCINLIIAKLKQRPKTTTQEIKPHFLLMIISCLCLSILSGLLLPASVISTSPIEFSFIGSTDSPLSYIGSAFVFFLGLWFFWPMCIYFLFSKKVKRVIPFVMASLFLFCLANAYIFKSDYGLVNIFFNFENALSNTGQMPTLILTILFLAGVVLLLLFAIKFQKVNLVSLALFSIFLASTIFSTTKILKIKSTYDEYVANKEIDSGETNNNSKYTPIFELTNSGKNVIVMFFDRAVNSFFPYIFNDAPELREQLKGFTYYPNTLSFSQSTITGAPPMMGGYEYTPQKINERKNELLVDKNNEANLVMPKLFQNAGFNCIVTDPPYSNYKWRGDYTPYKNENIKAMSLYAKYSLDYLTEHGAETIDASIITRKEIKNFVCLQIMPRITRAVFYNNFRNQDPLDTYSFVNLISSLYYLPQITKIADAQNQFIFFDCDATHDPIFLDADFLLPTTDRSLWPKISYQTTDDTTIMHYHAFVATFKSVGKFCDYLRVNGVYDNTRIIIVSDHGRGGLDLNYPNNKFPVGTYHPLFLIKDFNSNDDVKTDETFMTNADTLFLAKKDLPISNINPYTGNEFTQEKNGEIIISEVLGWNAEEFIDKTQFTFSQVYRVNHDFMNEEAWTEITEDYKEAQ